MLGPRMQQHDAIMHSYLADRQRYQVPTCFLFFVSSWYQGQPPVEPLRLELFFSVLYPSACFDVSACVCQGCRVDDDLILRWDFRKDLYTN
jgi:hypothetical protein